MRKVYEPKYCTYRRKTDTVYIRTYVNYGHCGLFSCILEAGEVLSEVSNSICDHICLTPVKLVIIEPIK